MQNKIDKRKKLKLTKKHEIRDKFFSARGKIKQNGCTEKILSKFNTKQIFF